MIITTYRCLRFTPSSILSTPRSRLRALSTIPHCSRWVDLVSVPLRRTILSDPLKSIRLRPAVTSANYHNLLENPFTKRLAIFRYHIITLSSITFTFFILDFDVGFSHITRPDTVSMKVHSIRMCLKASLRIHSEP